MTGKFGTHYVVCNREEATHVILLDSRIIQLFSNVCIPIHSKEETFNNNVYLEDLNFDGTVKPNSHFHYNWSENNRPQYCKLGSPGPATIEDIKKHLEIW